MATRPLASHILPSSATMLGICVTGIGLVKIIEGRIGPSHVDEYFALNGLLFLASAFNSYLSIRMKGASISARYERVADACFMAGLGALTVISILFAYETI